MLSSRTKHFLHCCLLFTVIAVFEIFSGAVRIEDDRPEEFDPWLRYGYFTTYMLYLIRLLTFLPLPQVLFNFVGLILYNAFPDNVQLKGSPLLAPFLCIRIVTRGDYPQLVRNNVARNMTKCTDAGLENFLIEVVTDKAVGLPAHRRVREVVVPPSYRPKSGALFKARALQYCLEDGVNILADNDWVVHLDEETLLTENSVRGILNFVLDGKHHFGQGLITYANEDVVNWVTTLADSFRVADDMGKLRVQFYMFHKPLFSWKGSYVVTQFIYSVVLARTSCFLALRPLRFSCRGDRTRGLLRECADERAFLRSGRRNATRSISRTGRPPSYKIELMLRHVCLPTSGENPSAVRSLTGDMHPLQ